MNLYMAFFQLPSHDSVHQSKTFFVVVKNFMHEINFPINNVTVCTF